MIILLVGLDRMRVSGHRDVQFCLGALSFESDKKVVAEAAFAVGAVGTPSTGVPCIQAIKMEPAIRIERTTCGLRISDSPISDNLTPQETTMQDAPDMGPGGAGLSCPGSSVVAEREDEKELEPM